MITDTAGTVIGLAASECGITAVLDPYASQDPVFVQLCNILNSAGRELLGLHSWQRLTKSHSFLTVGAQQTYVLPTDFGYMIDQTHWDRSNDFPLHGPISPQEWAYLKGSGPNGAMHISFRVAEGVMQLLPDPVGDGQEITFEYVSKNWIQHEDSSYADLASSRTDVVLYESLLIVKFLKLRFLEAKGFDTTAATNQFTSAFTQWTGKDISAPVLSMAGNRSFPYLGWRNIPETNYGMP